MPGSDWIPVVSQAKSFCKLACGDYKGAERTHENFWRECPGFSQVTSAVQLATGDPKGALETQKRCLKTIGNIADGTPVIGHVKGGVHHLVGDSEGGNRALYAATRPLVILGGATVGGMATGGPGAIPAGMAAVMTYDGAVSLLSGKNHGVCAAIENLIENPRDPEKTFDAALMGYSDFNYSKGHNTTIRDYRRRIADVRDYTSGWIAPRAHGRRSSSPRAHRRRSSSPRALGRRSSSPRAHRRRSSSPRAHGRGRTSSRTHECPCTSCREHRRQCSRPRSDRRRRSYDEYYYDEYYYDEYY